MPRIPIVDTIIEKDGKILLVKRNFPPKGKLDIPGGYVDKNESLEDAAIREVKEETGFDVKLIQKLGEYDYFDKQEKTAYVFIGEIIGGKLKESIEGKPIWVKPKKITSKNLSCPQQFIPILKDYLKIRGS